MSEDGRWLVITVGDGQVGDRGVEAIHVLDLRAPGARPIPLVDGFDAEYRYVTSEGATFYLQTSQDAPRGRVIAIDAATPQRAAWRTILAQGEHPIASVVRAGDRLFVATLVDASTRLHAFELDGTPWGELALPGLGSAYMRAARRDAAQAFYVFTSFATPATIYRHDLNSGRSEPFRAPRGLLDPADYEVKQVFYASADGTRVPMFVAHRKGLALDGSHPTLLTGYGGFGISNTPGYSSSQAWWLSIGGVIAEPCLRGGGEYGEAWHRAATKTSKQKTFDDFIAAAEWLTARGYTSPRKLMSIGGSNGGLLVAAALTQRPELFGAVVVQVGVLDMLRFHLVGQGEGWQGDYGSPEVPEEFRALLAYSPLHRVKPGTRYPALLAVTGDHDTRVAPWHSFKFVAALQAAQAGPAPILLQLESSAGHGGGTTTRARLRSSADLYAFALAMLGVRL